MNKVKISIVVPAYNIEKYLSRCLDSLLNQTYQNLEILVVNDGSTDGTGRLLDDYSQKDYRIRAIHQENSGVTKARFTAIKAATGEWIGFVDGDDYIEPNMYERLIENAHRYGADISHCGYQMVFPNRVDYYYNTGKLLQQDNGTALKDLIQGQQIEPGLWNKLYHKTLFDELMKSDVENSGIKMNEDLLMNFYLFQKSQKSVYEDFCPYHYMIRKGSATTTRRSASQFQDPIHVWEKVCELTKPDLDLYRLAFTRLVGVYIRSGCQNEFPQIGADSRKKLKRIFRNKTNRLLSWKQSCMAMTVAYFRPIYRFIRWIYEKSTHINNKYDVE